MKKLIALILMTTLLITSSVYTAFASETNSENKVEVCAASSYTGTLNPGNTSVRIPFYCSGGTTVKFSLKASGNPRCYFRCQIITTSTNEGIVTLPDVLGDGVDEQSATAWFLSAGYYQAVIIPVNGTLSGETVNMYLTVD